MNYETYTHERSNLESFLDREQERYRKQLEQYAALVRARQPPSEIGAILSVA